MVQRYALASGRKEKSENGPLVKHDDYAALEAERDELAARLRAVKEWANGHAPGKKFPPLSRLFAALDGPVPECRACAEIMPLAKRLEGFFCNGVVAWSLLTKENMNQAADDMVEIQRILARHAADEGEEHE